ncbi:MAG: hypothetical protein QXO30_01640 [Candidatus Caldarchaeum sp.]
MTGLLLVSNFDDVLKLFIWRKKEVVLKLRNNWGELKANFTDFLLWSRLFLRGVVIRGVGGKAFASYEGGIILSPSMRHTAVLTEPFEELYHDSDFRGKRVLDVGGYLGETAFLFHKWGAAHVTVYEPDFVLGKFAELNLKINNVNGSVRPLFVNASCSHKAVDWNTVLREKFDIAKVDCEGCEVYLLDVADEVLARVPEWVIECHTPKVLHKLGHRFSKAGFSVYFKPYYWTPSYSIVGKPLSLQNGRPKTPLTLLYAKYAVDNPMTTKPSNSIGSYDT